MLVFKMSYQKTPHLTVVGHLFPVRLWLPYKGMEPSVLTTRLHHLNDNDFFICRVPDRPSIRRVSEHDLYKASDSSPTGVYLSPASTPNEDDFSDSASNWSESEFDDDYDDGGEAFSSLDQESIGSISINSDGKSEVR